MLRTVGNLRVGIKNAIMLASNSQIKRKVAMKMLNKDKFEKQVMYLLKIKYLNK